MVRGLVFSFLHSKTLLGIIYSFVPGSPHTFLSIFRASSLALVDTLLMSNYLPICFLRHLRTQSQRKRGDDRSDFFRLYRGVMELWVPFACCLSGCIQKRAEKVTCFSIVQVLVREILVIPGDLRYSRRHKLNKKVKGMWPKDEQKQKSCWGATRRTRPRHQFMESVFLWVRVEARIWAHKIFT